MYGINHTQVYVGSRIQMVSDERNIALYDKTKPELGYQPVGRLYGTIVKIEDRITHEAYWLRLDGFGVDQVFLPRDFHILPDSLEQALASNYCID